jgi:hypothetical protein
MALLDNFQNCALMNCQRNVNSLLPPELSHTFSYIAAIFIHNHFESPSRLLDNFNNNFYLRSCKK